MVHVQSAKAAQDWHAFTARRIVATEFKVAESELMAKTRAKARIAFARQVAMYLAHVVFSMSYNDIAAIFGRERSTVSHACAVVEDARDDKALDDLLDKLEDRLLRLDALRRGERTIRTGMSPSETVCELRA